MNLLAVLNIMFAGLFITKGPRGTHNFLLTIQESCQRLSESIKEPLICFHVLSCQYQRKVFVFSIYQISGQHISRFLIGSRNWEYLWISTVLGRDSKWLFVSRQFRKMKFLTVNEAAAPTNTAKKETQFGLSVFTGRQKKILLLNLQHNHKRWSPKHCALKRKQTLSDVLY